MSDEAYKPAQFLFWGILYCQKYNAKEKLVPIQNDLKNKWGSRRRQKLETPGVVYMSITLSFLGKNLYNKNSISYSALGKGRLQQKNNKKEERERRG